MLCANPFCSHKWFIPRNRNNRFCSSECRTKGLSIKRCLQQPRKRCPICQEMFSQRTNSHRFCSTRCKNKERVVKNALNRGTKNCLYCTGEFKPVRRTQKYCCKSCKNRHVWEINPVYRASQYAKQREMYYTNEVYREMKKRYNRSPNRRAYRRKYMREYNGYAKDWIRAYKEAHAENAN